MLAKIWLVVEMIMKLLKLWESFADHVETSRKAEAESRRQEREKAQEDLQNAQTEEEIFDAQERIVRNKP